MPTEKVSIVPYDPRWPAEFRDTGMVIRTTLRDVALRVDHIGSTAVPGLDAKPVIDIQISVQSLEPVDLYRIPLEELGYRFRLANPERTKRYFREPPGQRRTHIHVRRAGSWAEQFALLFRDYLRAHREEAARYAAIKYRLAEEFSTDRRAYTEAKASYVWEIMRKADGWSQVVGWQPGEPDL